MSSFIAQRCSSSVFSLRYSWVLGDVTTAKCGARCIERLLVGRSVCVSLCAALRKPATPAVAIRLLELSCVAAPLSLPVWQQLFDWAHLNMHGTRIWASVWETIPSVTKPYNLETAPPSLWLLYVAFFSPCFGSLLCRYAAYLARTSVRRGISVLERALQQRSLRTCPALWSALGTLTLQHKGPRSYVGVFYRAVDACTFRCVVTSFLSSIQFLLAH
jgi:hypothetical protein